MVGTITARSVGRFTERGVANVDNIKIAHIENDTRRHCGGKDLGVIVRVDEAGVLPPLHRRLGLSQGLGAPSDAAEPGYRAPSRANGG